MIISQTHWNCGNPFIKSEPFLTLDANRYFATTAEMSYEWAPLHLFDVLPAAARVRAPDILCAAEQLNVRFVAEPENDRPVRYMLPARM